MDGTELLGSFRQGTVPAPFSLKAAQSSPVNLSLCCFRASSTQGLTAPSWLFPALVQSLLISYRHIPTSWLHTPAITSVTLHISFFITPPCHSLLLFPSSKPLCVLHFHLHFLTFHLLD